MPKLLNAKDIFNLQSYNDRLQVQGTKKYFLLKEYHSMTAKSNLEYTLHKPTFVLANFDSLILWLCHLCEGKLGKVMMKI